MKSKRAVALVQAVVADHPSLPDGSQDCTAVVAVSLDLAKLVVYNASIRESPAFTLTSEVGMTVMTVNVHEAKTQLSKLLLRISMGEEVVIAKAGKPVARLVPFAAKPTRRVAGSAQGKVWMAPDFDAPLPDELLEAFEA